MIAHRPLLAFVGTLPLIRRATGQTAHRLTILHVNDFHSRHDPVDPPALMCTPGDNCFGGSPRLATAIAVPRRAAEADGRAVLQLDAGDQFQGSLFYTALHGDAKLAVMHAAGTEAMTVSNLEFDNGPVNLACFVRAARVPVLSANVDASEDPDVALSCKPQVCVSPEIRPFRPRRRSRCGNRTAASPHSTTRPCTASRPTTSCATAAATTCCGRGDRPLRYRAGVGSLDR